MKSYQCKIAPSPLVATPILSRASRRHDLPMPLAFRDAPFDACSMSAATAWGCDTYTEWLPLTSTTVEPARLDIARCASGGIILSSVVSRYQLGFVFHAGCVMAPPSASTPHGTWESA